MAKYPKIDSPCPYQGDLAAVMDGGHCRECDRDVIDLTAWSDGERSRFLASSESEVCVSYRLPVRPALIAAAMAAAVAALPAAAQEVTVVQVAAVSEAQDVAWDEDDYIVVGGISDPKNTELTVDPEDAKLPEMPVVYEEPAPAKRPEPAKPASAG